MLLIVGKRKDVRAGRAHRRDIAFAARSNRIERDIRQAPQWREGIHGNAALDIAPMRRTACRHEADTQRIRAV